jgi:Ribbon-helix-helix protein, copG family
MAKSVTVDVPRKEKVKWVLVQTQIPQSIAKQIDEDAKDRCMSRAEYLRELITRVVK